MIKCPECGVEQTSESPKFCSECGHQFGQEISTLPTSAEDVKMKLSKFQYDKLGEGKYSIFRLKDKFAESVEIPEGVIEIQSYAFSGCATLRSVTFPDTLVKINRFAFQDCTALESIHLPDSVSVLEKLSFRNCYSLKNVRLSRGLKSLESQVFEGANALCSIVIPETVKRIGSDVFYGTAITCLDLPVSVTYLAYGALHGNIEEVRYAGTRAQWNLIQKEDGYKNSNLKITCVDDPKETPKPTQVPPSEPKPTPTPSAALSSSPASGKSSGGCYVATCVYGSYDCPEVWTLRRYRDDTLGATWYGRAFIRVYYAVSPTLVKWFGETKWFKRLWRGKLDRMVKKLQEKGVENTPYNDKIW